MDEVINGITVIISCYNSVGRLYPTLKHLSLQIVPENIPWEIILVNNASTDQTASFAIETWNSFSREFVNFRVIDEPAPGQMYARKRGAIEAKYDCLIFCDDDNWLDTQYIFQSKKTMDINKTIGACGGQNAPVTDAPEYPAWFDTYKDKYALGIPAPESGDVSHRGFILGAGLVTRRSLFLRLLDERYPSLLPGRNGEELSTGDDFEYCKRLLLWGYSLQYNADMKLLHFIPKERLTVQYRDRLMKGIADAGKVLAEYDKALEIKKKIQNKSRLRLILMTPFRILLAQLGWSGRKANEERLKLFYLLPFQWHANNNRRMIKKLFDEKPARKKQTI
jgi:glycosyltransferase involved in cell wall biosynthesis